MTALVPGDPKIGFVYPGSRIDCPSCGVLFWMTSDLEQRRRDDHKNFYCPNGHAAIFMAETDGERYKRLHAQEKDRATRLLAERDQIAASRRAWKGQVTRLRNRAIEGDCPLCGQHLRDVARHVTRMHPGEQADMTEVEVSA